MERITGAHTDNARHSIIAGVWRFQPEYLDFGFAPDLNPPFAREAWAAFRQRLDHPALRDV